jgi:hypothetical protein
MVRPVAHQLNPACGTVLSNNSLESERLKFNCDALGFFIHAKLALHLGTR